MRPQVTTGIKLTTFVFNAFCMNQLETVEEHILDKLVDKGKEAITRTTLLQNRMSQIELGL